MGGFDFSIAYSNKSTHAHVYQLEFFYVENCYNTIMSIGKRGWKRLVCIIPWII